MSSPRSSDRPSPTSPPRPSASFRAWLAPSTSSYGSPRLHPAHPRPGGCSRWPTTSLRSSVGPSPTSLSCSIALPGDRPAPVAAPTGSPAPSYSASSTCDLPTLFYAGQGSLQRVG